MIRSQENRKVTSAAMREWWTDNIPANYPDRTLTFREDRLPAISGIGKYVADATGDAYLAGIWKEDILHPLLFSLNNAPLFGVAIQNLKVLNPYVAPSWSWASNPRGFTYGAGMWTGTRDAHLVPAYNSINVSTTLDGPNLLGRVKSGLLQIDGKLLPIPLTLILVHNHQFANNQIWKIEDAGKHIAYFELDWTVMDAEDHSLEGLLMLLLVKSDDCDLKNSNAGDECCGCLIEAMNIEQDFEATEEEDSERSESEGSSESCDIDMGTHATSVLHWVESNTDERADDELVKGYIDNGDVEDEDDMSSTSQGMEEDSEDGFSTDEGNHDQCAWGLILYPANDSQYSRVGIFCSHASELGGLKLFDHCPYQNVEII